jgi:hypothetical protein
MEPLCWGATERTAGVFPRAMSGQDEDFIIQLDLCNFQFLWQCKQSRHFHLLHLILLQQSFY